MNRTPIKIPQMIVIFILVQWKLLMQTQKLLVSNLLRNLFRLIIYASDDDQPASKYWSVKLETGDQYISYKIDTDADVNVLPKHLYCILSPRPKLKQTQIKLQAYNGSQIPVYGKCIAPILHKGKRYT